MENKMFSTKTKPMWYILITVFLSLFSAGVEPPQRTLPEKRTSTWQRHRRKRPGLLPRGMGELRYHATPAGAAHLESVLHAA